MNICISAAIVFVLSIASAAAAQTTVTSGSFGAMPDGSPVTKFTIKDASLTVAVVTYGAHIIAIDAPDRNGAVADVVLGYDTLAAYMADKATYFGAVVGRYGNRIGKGRFTLDGKPVQLDLNNNGNTLHGGSDGFDRKNWTGRQVPGGVELTLISPDGDMGFPGTLTAHVRYTLNGAKLHIDYSATTDRTTVVNLTQHSYFNLAGSGSILDQRLMIDADTYTQVDPLLIPTGTNAAVAGTPFDFRKPTPVGAHINDADPQLLPGKGYDHNWVLNAPHTLAKPQVTLTDPASGRMLKIYTTEPGVQFYAGNGLDGTLQSRNNGGPYNRYAGLALETQHYPDSPNHPEWPSTTLKAGKTYKTTTILEFTLAK